MFTNRNQIFIDKLFPVYTEALSIRESDICSPANKTYSCTKENSIKNFVQIEYKKVPKW